MKLVKALLATMLFVLVGCNVNKPQKPFKNEEPQPIKVIYFNPDGTVNLEVNYEYIEGKAITIKENDLVTKLEYDNNLVIKSTNDNRTILYEYDSNGNEIKKTTNDGEMITVERNEYDSFGNLIKKDTMVNNENVMHIDYKYVENQLVEMASSTMVVKYEYENDKCIEEKYYSADKLMNTIKYVFKDNQLIETHNISENTTTSILFYSYNEEGNVIQIETSLDQGATRYISTQYEY